MEIYLYNPQLELMGVLDDYFSLRWRRKYATCGEFELHCNVTPQSLRWLAKGNIVAKKGSSESGVIEGVSIEDNAETGETIKVTGRFLSSYLERRLTGDTYIFRGTAENAMRYHVTQNCILPADLDRKMPLLELGNLIGDKQQVELQTTYKNLLSTNEKLARKSALGFRIRADFAAKKLIFEVYAGTNRSVNQNTNAPVVFSDEYDNTKNTAYSSNNTTLKTFCVVKGNDGTDGKVIVSAGSGEGINRREVFVQASETKSAESSLEEFKTILNTVADDTLKAAVEVETFETEVDILKDYKSTWDLGDIVTCMKKRWGKSINERITEVEEVYENGIVQIIPVLGTPEPELIDLLKEDN